MKRLLLSLMALCLTTGIVNPHAFAGNTIGGMRKSSSSALRCESLSDSAIADLQKNATDMLHAYGPLSQSAKVFYEYTPIKFRGTSYNLGREPRNAMRFLYFSVTPPKDIPIIVSFISANEFSQGIRSVNDVFRDEIYFLGTEGFKYGNAYCELSDRMAGVRDVMMQAINSNETEFRKMPKAEKEKFMKLYRTVNKWDLFTLLNAEYKKMVKDRKSEEDFGFLIIELPDVTAKEGSPSDNIKGLSTFYIKTVSRKALPGTTQ